MLFCDQSVIGLIFSFIFLNMYLKIHCRRVGSDSIKLVAEKMLRQEVKKVPVACQFSMGIEKNQFVNSQKEFIIIPKGACAP